MPKIITKISERKERKKREINREIPLNEYIDKINIGEISNYETVDISMGKLGKNTEVENMIHVELEHAQFQIRELKKNGHLTHFGKFSQNFVHLSELTIN